jgi:hypothetical protein
MFVRLVLGHLHTVEVVGSNPAVPTIKSTTYKLRAGIVCGFCDRTSKPCFLSSFIALSGFITILQRGKLPLRLLQ